MSTKLRQTIVIGRDAAPLPASAPETFGAGGRQTSSRAAVDAAERDGEPETVPRSRVPTSGEASSAHASQMTLSDLGARIRKARKEKGMTLREVADEVGCSPSMLSKIETEQATPSLRTLHRIAAVLDISITHLFGAEAQPEEISVIRSDARPAVQVRRNKGGASIFLERLSPTVPDMMLSANIHTLEPGAESGGDIQHAGQEVGYVLQGTAELIVAGKSYHLTAGDSFFFASTLPHRYRNLDIGVTRILWVATPATF
ncbi:XRE family transcriptional regulator [Breoghania corrubedonensis]|uniref:XRE family transcriptional regulator n=1 Tax=Breoghania corrubedonensis TaxID=665038 RepID=A0A2T5VI40_9HYPH|nr:cupin domain-containing protein [Breoghania corrubedonensis]PTW63429.1 XRE family transcriptional regulator [Breoghania corrubedonensis]